MCVCVCMWQKMVQAEATADYVLQRLAATQVGLHILKQS